MSVVKKMWPAWSKVKPSWTIDRQSPPVRACFSARRKSVSSRCSAALSPAGPPPTIRLRALPASTRRAFLRGASARPAASSRSATRRRIASATASQECSAGPPPLGRGAARRRSRPRPRSPARRSAPGRRRRRPGRRGRGPRRRTAVETIGLPAAMYSSVLVGLIRPGRVVQRPGHQADVEALQVAGQLGVAALAEEVEVAVPRQRGRVDLDRPGRPGRPSRRPSASARRAIRS